MLEIWLEIAKTFSLIASLPPGGRHKVEVGGQWEGFGGGSRNGDESASLDLFLVIELTCFKSSHLEFPVVPRAQSLFHPVQLGSRRSQGVFFFCFFPQPWRLIDSCLTPQPPPPPTTTTTPTYAISFRTPLWLAGPPRNESPARSPRRDIAQNEWGLRSYFQGKPVRSRLTSPPPHHRPHPRTRRLLSFCRVGK